MHATSGNVTTRRQAPAFTSIGKCKRCYSEELPSATPDEAKSGDSDSGRGKRGGREGEGKGEGGIGRRIGQAVSSYSKLTFLLHFLFTFSVFMRVVGLRGHGMWKRAIPKQRRNQLTADEVNLRQRRLQCKGNSRLISCFLTCW